jgi:hypothetical protein
MTPPDDSSRDGARDEPGPGAPDGHAGPELPDDVDAAFRAIVENYGDRPALSDPDDPSPAAGAGTATPPVDPSLFDTAHLDDPDPQAGHTEDRHAEEEHFVPPEPPPIPRGTPARRVAWLGLFVPPLVMLAAVVLGWVLPEWFSVLLVGAFVGGFVFLVATMPRERYDGDDGAVV